KINFFRVLIAVTDVAPEKRLAAFAPRSAQLENMLRRSRERGEAPPSLEDVTDHVLAPLYVRALVGLPLSRRFAERLVDRLLA
ncbi:MAG TPA: TetR-like C-terminal domain-containing protein, partial [Spirochaetia bacterium]|nr:TetR-like C-terminal domain-containing protein [Spirochaetia bacterium]